MSNQALASRDFVARRRADGKPKLWRHGRTGSATIDYFLLICIVLPLAAFILRIAPRAMHSVYDFLTVVVAWPVL
jgi:hypothetical protein